MKYVWENDSLQKYGEEITAQLIEQQKQYEKNKQDNDCLHCGISNQGTIVEIDDKKPIIIHYGLFTYSNGVRSCDYCRKQES